MDDQFDVVIVGAGMVGASLACAIHNTLPTLKLAIVEAFTLTVPDVLPSYDARSTAVSWGSRQLFEQINLWPAIEPHVTSIDRIQVSDRGLPAAARLDGKKLNLDTLGYVIENRQLGKVLLQSILHSEQIQVIAPARVKGFKPHRSGGEIYLESKGDQDSKKTSSTISAQLVVVADGTDSELRQKMGIHADLERYEQSALIANISVDRQHRNMAYERFTGNGPVALLPLAEHDQDRHRFALVWYLEDSECDRMLELNQREFLAELHSSFGYRAGRFIKVGSRSKHQLMKAQSREQIRQGCVILGNAAHTMNPVAAQGFNLSFRDIMCLTSVLQSAHHRGIALGSLSILEDYVKSRRQDQRRVQQLAHHVVKLFMMDQIAPRLIRQLGLLTLDFVPAIKNGFIAFTAGLRSDTP